MLFAVHFLGAICAALSRSRHGCAVSKQAPPKRAMQATPPKRPLIEADPKDRLAVETTITWAKRHRKVGTVFMRPVAIGLLVTGCNTIPPEPIALRATAEQFQARRIDDPGLAAFARRPGSGVSDWPPAHLDVRALDLAALYFSPNLQLARTRWNVAKAVVRTAGEIPNPSLSLNPLYVVSAAAGASPWFVSAGLIQIIETMGKRPKRVARASYLAEAARLDVRNTAWTVVGQVNGYLLDVAAADARIAALDQQIAAQTGLVDAAEKRLRVGLGSFVELSTARLVLTRAILDRQSSVAARVDAQHRLADAIGVPSAALPLDRLVLPRLDQRLPPDLPGRIKAKAALNRADLLAALANYAASTVELQLQTAGRYPNVELGPGFEYDQGDRKWGLSLAVQLPVFNRNGGPIAEAEAQRRQAADQFTADQARVIGEVDRTIAAYAEALRSLDLAVRLFDEQARRAKAQEALFVQGEIDRLELLAARAELATAVVGRADAQGTVAKARLAVELAGQISADGLDPGALIFPES